MSSPPESVRDAARALAAASRPLLLVGPEGAAHTAALLRLADAIGAAILTTPDALSVIDGARSLGVFSFGASARAKSVARHADVVLAVSALGEFTCRLGEAFTEQVLIQLTEHVGQIRPQREPNFAVIGPLPETLARLSAALTPLSPKPCSPWFEGLPIATQRAPAPRRPGVIEPGAAMRAIQAALPPRARLCLDITSGALHAYSDLAVTTSQRVFSSIESSACMGEALLASLGVRLASGLPTLALVGDWCHCMTPGELHTAVELGLDRYVVLVWANGGGAFIGAGVEQQGILVPDAVWRWRTPPDFARLAEGYGARGVVVTDAGTLEHELAAGLAGTGPMLIEARIDPDAPIPAGDRFLSLGEAHAAPARQP